MHTPIRCQLSSQLRIPSEVGEELTVQERRHFQTTHVTLFTESLLRHLRDDLAVRRLTVAWEACPRIIRYHFREPFKLGSTGEGPLIRETFGFKILLNPADEAHTPMIMSMGVWEYATTTVFVKSVSRGSTVVDVGANIGWYTLLARQKVGPTGKVIAFEPEHRNFGFLSQSARLNGFDGLVLKEECVADTTGKRILHLSADGSTGTHSIKKDMGGGSVEVPCITLDDAMDRASVNRIDLLKIDAEYAEPEVLRGARQLLQHQAIPQIIMEWSPSAWTDRMELSMLFELYDFFEITRRFPFVWLRKLHNDDLPLPGSNLYLRLINR